MATEDATSADPRLAGLKGGSVGAIVGRFTTDRALWVVIVAALLLLMALRGVFRGALGD